MFEDDASSTGHDGGTSSTGIKFSNRRMSEGGSSLSESLYMNNLSEVVDELYMNNLTDEQTDVGTDKQDEEAHTSWNLEPLGFTGRSVSRTSLFDDTSPGLESSPEVLEGAGSAVSVFRTSLFDDTTPGLESSPEVAEGAGSAGSEAACQSDPLYDIVANLLETPYDCVADSYSDPVLTRQTSDEQTDKLTDLKTKWDDMPMPGD